jgi:transposase-like protein
MSYYTNNAPPVRSTASEASVLPVACPDCRSATISTTAKTPDANSYWRCAQCGAVWNAGRTRSANPRGGAWR